MATTNRGKESTSSSAGKEKKVPCWNSQSKKSSTGTGSGSGSGSEKQVPNYLRPTISSRLEPHQRSFQLRSDSISKANLDRRRSFDRPPSLKQSSLSFSRLHNALVSPGPRERTVSRRVSSSSSLSAKSSSSASTKTISKTTLRDGKLQKKLTSAAVKKTITGSRNKKQASSANSTTTAPNSIITAETTDKTPSVEEIDHHQQEIKEAQSHDCIVEETPELVNDDEPQIRVDNDTEHHVEEVIPAESEELKTGLSVEEEKEEEEEEKPTEINDIEHQVGENVNQEEKSNDVISHPQEISATEGEPVEVNEKEKEEEEEKHHEIVPPVYEKSHHDVKEELEVTEEDDDGRVSEEIDNLKVNVKGELGDGRASEEVDNLKVNVKGELGDDDQVENSDETIKNESTATPKHVATNSGGKGKESPQAYNDVIEETKNKLMGARKNKVSALVGAFQTVIDYESSSSK